MARPTPRPFEIAIGPPYRGLNDFLDYRKAKGWLSNAVACDLSRGVVQGAWTPGNSVAAVTALSRFMFFQAGAGWITDTVFLADGTTNWAYADAPTGTNPTAYLTQVQAGGSVNSPKAYYGPNSYQLGIPAPTTVAAVNNVAGGARTYSYTLYDPTLGFESNPKAIGTSTGCVGATVSSLQTTAPGTTATKIRIYGTNAGSAAASMQYLLTEQNLGTASWVDPGTNGLTAFPLDFGAGGFFTTPTLNADHAEAPLLTCLSDGPHAATIGLGKGGGIPFGAMGATVRWGVLNRAFYWPALNQYTLPYLVLAMVSRERETYAFTEGGIWAFSGVSDSAIQARRTRAHLGVLKGAGKTVVQTPYGVLYVSRRGVTLFDGERSTVITEGILDPLNYAFSNFLAGAYYDGHYLLSNGTNTWVVDLRDFPQAVTVSKALTNAANPMPATAFHVVPATVTGGVTPGLYVNYDANARPWRPAEQTGVAGAAQAAFNIKTTGHDLDNPAKIKRIRHARVLVTAPVTLTFTADMNGTTTNFQVSAVPGQRSYPFPGNFDCLHLQVQAVAGSGAARLIELNVIGDVFDAA